MLVLTRRQFESLRIGEDIEITVVDIRGDKVRIGVTAPNGVTIYRDEVYQAIQREKGNG